MDPSHDANSVTFGSFLVDALESWGGPVSHWAAARVQERRGAVGLFGYHVDERISRVLTLSADIYGTVGLRSCYQRIFAEFRAGMANHPPHLSKFIYILESDQVGDFKVSDFHPEDRCVGTASTPEGDVPGGSIAAFSDPTYIIENWSFYCGRNHTVLVFPLEALQSVLSVQARESADIVLPDGSPSSLTMVAKPVHDAGALLYWRSDEEDL